MRKGMNVMKKEMTCIVCPVGCRMTVETDDGGNVLSVEGNTCARGKKYAISEFTNPVRTLTSSVRIDGGTDAFLPVRTAQPIPKGMLFAAMNEIKKIRVKAPISVGDVIAEDIAGSRLIACKNVAAL